MIRDAVTTPMCSVAGGAYMRALATMLLARHGVWLPLPVLACMTLALVDVRYGLAAALFLLMVAPMALALLYFNFAFAPIARWSVMRKTLTFTPQGIELEFEHERMKPHFIAWREVDRVLELRGNVLVVMRSGRYSFLMFPADLIDGDPSVGELCRQLLAGVEQ